MEPPLAAGRRNGLPTEEVPRDAVPRPEPSRAPPRGSTRRPDPWDPWDDGPHLRADSFTARQLSYLSREAVHLESRRVFIGDFPADWIEQNCGAWMAAAHRAMDKLSSREDESDSDSPGDANADAAAPSLFERVAPELVPSPRRATAEPVGAALSSVERPSASARARQEQEMVAEITQATRANDEQIGAQRRSISRKRRRLRARFRHNSLREAPMDVVAEPQSAPQSASQSAPRSQSRLQSRSQSRAEPPAEPHVQPHASASTTAGSVAAESTISSDRTRVAPACDTASANTATCASARSVQTTYYDCDEEIMPDKTTATREARRAAVKPPVSIADPPVASVHAHPRDETLARDGARAGLDDEDEATRTVSDNSKPDTLSMLSTVPSRKLARLKRHAHVRFSHHRHRQLVYQGRYLVEVRESAQAKPVVSETDAPLATSLVSRWKEYAVFAKYTGNVQRPLCLYFYDAVKETKLTRRAKRAWSRSLDFKITLDPYYELKIFSPLDLTMALWRPHLSTDRNRERKRKTKIIILHAQSISSIWDISFLLGSVVQGASQRQRTHHRVNVGVPSIDVDVQLMIDAHAHHRREAGHDRLTTLTYEELQQPLVATSPTLKLIVGKVWDAVRSLPRRYNVSSVEAGAKFALAWQQTMHLHRELWVPSMSDEMPFMTRLFWLMQPCGNLQLLVPEPKCYEGELVEPPGVEGYCMSVDTGAPYSKGLSFAGKLGMQYLCTHDHYLLYLPGPRAEPPMLASSQTTLEKSVDPYPLDENGDIRWIKDSTCLREIDYHDTLARLELERRIKMVSQARGFIDLRYTDRISADGNVAGELLIDEGKTAQYKIHFSSQALAKSWESHLNQVASYWRAVHSTELLRRVAGTHKPMSITPYVGNRTILYSGPLFYKKHRFTTFKRSPVILTMHGLVVFRIDESTRQATDPNSPTPAAAYDFRRCATYTLEDTYIYTGQLAKHALLNDDKHIDPNNPGVRALPRAYEDSWVSQDTELDRCFVVWKPRASRMQKLLRTTGTGSYLTFLARDKHERDHWVTAIRYVQSELASKTQDDIAAEDFNDTNLVDLSLSSKS